MPWTYEQNSGKMSDPNGKLLAVGYAGRGDGKNNPAMQDVKDIGPLPCGLYSIGEPVNTLTHGPFVLWLEPDPANQMFGRSAFGIHGDSVVEPGSASEGCVIMPRFARERIAASDDKQLRVMP